MTEVPTFWVGVVCTILVAEGIVFAAAIVKSIVKAIKRKKDKKD